MAKKNLISKFRNKYRLIIYNDSTFAETFSLRLSLFNTYIVFISIALIFILLGIFITFSTPLKEFIGSNEYVKKSKLYKNTLRLDSLENLLLVQDLQYKRIQLILAGKDSLLFNPNDTLNLNKVKQLQDKKQINYLKSKADSILRAEFESKNRFNVTQGQAAPKEQLLNLYLYPPIKNGLIIKEFSDNNSDEQHFGVTVATKVHSHIMATAEGTIINTNWSLEYGYKIIIQHDDNLISCYKHSSELLKKVGDKVNRGEAIAILGETNKKGAEKPHLHFELWHKGIPLNPQDFISF